MFRKISPENINSNAIHLIAREWMLVSAGTINRYNNMTASWGGLGNLWNKPVAFVFIRPPRFTYEFVEANSFFTLSFFEEKYKDMLQLTGTRSGREINKMKDLGLTAFESQNHSVYYKEARLVMECRKLYFQDIDPDHFIDENILKHYPKRDFHRIYVAEITECMENVIY